MLGLHGSGGAVELGLDRLAFDDGMYPDAPALRRR
jgi:hypothetical protein